MKEEKNIFALCRHDKEKNNNREFFISIKK